jgi:hypothetical protein
MNVQHSASAYTGRKNTVIFLLFRKTDDVFGPEILEPLCKFCYAKKFKMSAIKITEIVTIAPEISIGL